MVTRKLSASVGRPKPATQTRTAVVQQLLAPSTAEDDTVTGWQVLLDFGGGEVRSAGCSSSYMPVAGDIVVVSRYQNTLFIVDRITAGNTGDVPGGRVAYSYYDALAGGGYLNVPVSSEAAAPGLTVPVLMRNGACYDVEVFQPFSSATANAFGFFVIRQDAIVTGAQLTEFARTPTTTAGQVVKLHDTAILRNDTGVDLNTTLIIAVRTASTNAVDLYANPTIKPWVEVRLKGSSKMYPHAAPMPVPPDFTG